MLTTSEIVIVACLGTMIFALLIGFVLLTCETSKSEAKTKAEFQRLIASILCREYDLVQIRKELEVIRKELSKYETKPKADKKRQRLLETKERLKEEVNS